MEIPYHIPKFSDFDKTICLPSDTLPTHKKVYKEFVILETEGAAIESGGREGMLQQLKLWGGKGTYGKSYGRRNLFQETQMES